VRARPGVDFAAAPGSEGGGGRSVTEPMETSRQDRLARGGAASDRCAYDVWSIGPVRVNLLLLEGVDSLNRVWSSPRVATAAHAAAELAEIGASADATALAADPPPPGFLREFTRVNHDAKFTPVNRSAKFTRVNCRAVAGRAPLRAATTTREPILPGRLQQLGTAPASSFFFVAQVAAPTPRTSRRTP